MRKIELIGALAAVLGAAPLMAQGKGKGSDGVPPGHRPVPGMCRIWIDGVPPGKQPAPTDCATAVARRPANARVIFGDDTPHPGKGKTTEQSEACRSSGRMATVLGIPIPVPADDATCRNRDDDDDDILSSDRASDAKHGVTKSKVKPAKAKGKGGRT
jgi:hypothetical protein